MTSDRNHLQPPNFSEQKPASNPVLSIAQSFITEVRRYLIVVTPLLKSMYSPVLSRAKDNLLASLHLLEQELTLTDLKSGIEPSQQNEGAPPTNYPLAKSSSEDLTKLLTLAETDPYDSSSKETLLQLENEMYRQQISALESSLKRFSLDADVTLLVETAGSRMEDRFRETEKLLLEKQKQSEAVLERIKGKLTLVIHHLRKENDHLLSRVQELEQNLSIEREQGITYNADIDVFKQEIAHFTAENQHLETENETFTSELTDLRREIAELKHTISRTPLSAADSFSQIQTEVLSLRTILEQGLYNKGKDDDTLHQQEIQQLHADLEALNLANTEKQALIQSAESEISQLTLSLATLNSDYLATQDKCAELQLETVRLSSEKDMSTMEHLWETEKLNKEIVRLEEQCSRWDDLIAMSWEDALSWSIREVSKCQREIQELKERNLELEEEVSVLGNDNSFLQHEFEELEEVSKEKQPNFSIPDDQLEELKLVIEELKGNWAVAITREKEATIKVTQLIEENTKLRDWTGMLQEDISRSEEKWEATEAFQSFAQEKVKKDAEIKRLKNTILRLTEENMDLQRGLKSKDKEIAKCEERVYLTSKQMDFMRENLARIQGISKKETEVEEKESKSLAQYTVLLSKYEKMKLKCKKVKRDLAESVSKQENIRNSCQRVKKLQDTLSKRLKSAILREDQLKALQDELKEIRSLSLSRTADLPPPSLEAKLRNLSVRDSLPIEDVEFLSDELQNLDRKLEDLDLLHAPEAEAWASYPGSDSESAAPDQLIEPSVSDLEAEIQQLQFQVREQGLRLETLARIEKIVFERFPDSLNLVKVIEEVVGTVNRKPAALVKQLGIAFKRASVRILRPDDSSPRETDTSPNLKLKSPLIRLLTTISGRGETESSGQEKALHRANSNLTPRGDTHLEAGSFGTDESF